MSITRLRMWLRALLFRGRVESEMDKEMRLHLDLETEANIRAGMSPDAARRAALVAFRGVDRVKEAYRDALGTRVIDDAWRDLRHGLRAARRAPAFTITTLALLALAIGTTVAILSIAYVVLLRPLPYPEAHRLVFIAEPGDVGLAWPDFVDWRDRATSFDGLASSVADAVVMTSGDAPRRFEARNVTANFFRVLGTTAGEGRLFDDADARPTAASTVVVSHEFWMRELGGTRGALGRTISIGEQPYVVIGVLPPAFRYFTPADVYLLLEPRVAANYRGMQDRRNHTTLFAVGRLKPGVTLEVAQAEVRTIAAAVALAHSLKGNGAEVVPLTDRLVGPIAPTLRLLAGAVTLLLLIACVNFASLVLNRSAARAHEFSVRAAIGGSRSRLTRQLAVELALLTAAGGVLGALVGAIMIRAVVSVAPRDLPRLNEIGVDAPRLFWITLSSCAVAFAFGLVPALKTSGLGRRLGLQLGLQLARTSPRSTTSLRRGLMVAEIAVATVLLCGAGLMVHSMLRLARVDPGFDPRNVHTLTFSLTGPRWPDARKKVFFDQVVERLRAMPGVENAALTYSLPILGSNWWTTFNLPGRTAAYWTSVGETPNAGIVPVTAGYFETLRIPLIKGRYFERADASDAPPVAIITSSAAKRYWPGEDPIGKRIQLGPPEAPYGPWRTIVGVVGDIRQHGLDQDEPRQVFLPVVQEPRSTVFAVVRARRALPPSSLEAAVHDVDRGVPVFNTRTLAQVMREATNRRRVATVVLSIFGAVAVLLASIGLYGLIAQSVAERRKDIGIRMSLGATPSQVVRMFLGGALLAAAAGLASGVTIAVALSRSLQSLVFGVSPTDPLTLGGGVALLAVVALVASYIPARAAARVDPVRALRLE